MAGITTDNIKKITNFLEKQRGEILSLLERKYPKIADIAEDIFHDSYIDLFNDVKNGKLEILSQDSDSELFILKNGKLEKLTYTLRRYFIGICNNKALKSINELKKKGLIPIDTIETSLGDPDDEEYDASKVDEVVRMEGDDGITDEQRGIILKLIQNLPKQCNNILWDFYYDRLKMKIIADLHGYKNSDTVKTIKSRCVSKFKNKFNQIKKNFYATSI